jgi:transketolase C-terminal domain/subunit
MHVIITSHVKQRLREERQYGISIQDIIKGAQTVPGTIPVATRFRGFFSQNGRVFDIVAKDIAQGRLVITVIGK